MNAATDPRTDLATVINHWPDLEHALGTPSVVAPFGLGLTAYMAHLDALDADEVAELREARAWQRAGTVALDAKPLPLRVRVHDTMRAVEAALLHLADEIASAIQRPAAARVRPASPDDAVGLRLAAATVADQHDRRRWSYTNPSSRTAVLAAVWLSHRLDSAEGPFRPLTPPQRDRIAAVAAGAAQRVEDALDMTRRSRAIPQPCPHCRGPLVVEGGDGRPPAVRCTSTACGWTRTGTAA